MNTTNAIAFQLATQALRAGKVLQVPLYSGAGTITAGPNITAAGRGAQYAVHFYYPAGCGNHTREEFLPQDAARILLEYCGRGKLGHAARKALEG